MLQHHFISVGINVYKPTNTFFDNISVVLNATNPGNTLNKKTMVLRYHFFREHVSNNVEEVRKIHTKNSFVDPFIENLISNYSHGFYHKCMLNGQSKLWFPYQITECGENR